MWQKIQLGCNAMIPSAEDIMQELSKYTVKATPLESEDGYKLEVTKTDGN